MNARRLMQLSGLSYAGRTDHWLLVLWVALMLAGLVMVASASVATAALNYGDPWYFVRRHLVYQLLGIALALLVLGIPLEKWRNYGGLLLLLTLVLLAVVLVPGIGREVNGARRWLVFGPLTLQVSEVAKIAAVVFFAGFFTRHYERLASGWQGFVKPMAVLGLIAALLLAEPDFGAAVVICGTVVTMMFVVGVRLMHFTALLALAAAALSLMAVTTPYRMQRLIAFLDPWADQFNTGYQLTQSLIAFGRGEWFGQGLGNSVQKLFYLPEAHTDFIFAIVAEELGLIGALLVIALFAGLVLRMMLLARGNLASGNLFAGLLALGVAVLFSVQAFVNIGVASGLLPTKGLTLPFISYGGSSLLASCVAVALVLRVARESQPTAKVVPPAPTVQRRLQAREAV